MSDEIKPSEQELNAADALVTDEWMSRERKANIIALHTRDNSETAQQLRAKLDEAQAKIDQFNARLEKAEQEEIQLRAWQESFGTSQLTHALARLESAEKDKRKVQSEALRWAAKELGYSDDYGNLLIARDDVLAKADAIERGEVEI